MKHRELTILTGVISALALAQPAHALDIGVGGLGSVHVGRDGGGSGGGISWSSLVDVSTGRASDGNLGVLRYGEEAPPGATAVRIEYEGEHTVPVVHGHFLFVAWDTEFATDPRVVELITD